MGLQDAIARYGLPAVGIGAALEGDLTLLLGGVAAHLGYFSWLLCVAVGWCGAFISDFLWYLAGRQAAHRIRGGRIYRAVGHRVERLAVRIGPWQLLTARFIYGTKNASMLFWGLHGLSPGRFAAIDALGCFAGAVAFAGLGYLFSGSTQALLGRVHRIEFVLLGGLVAGVIVLVVLRRAARRRHLVDEDV
jgi:membrane protein DedA with SNARE-associated domain